MTRPLVLARMFGTDPSSEPKMRSWSLKSIARVDSRDCANCTAASRAAWSMPSSLAGFFCQAPARRVVDRGGGGGLLERPHGDGRGRAVMKGNEGRAGQHRHAASDRPSFMSSLPSRGDARGGHYSTPASPTGGSGAVDGRGRRGSGQYAGPSKHGVHEQQHRGLGVGPVVRRPRRTR